MNELTVVSKIRESLPMFNQGCTYNRDENMFISMGYTTDSAHYFQGGRCSNRLAVVFNCGQGYCYRFLNGVTIYGSNGKGGAVFLADYLTPMYCGWVWSEANAKDMAMLALKKFISSQCEVLGLPTPTDTELERSAEQLYGETVSMTAQVGQMLHEQRVRGLIA